MGMWDEKTSCGLGENHRREFSVLCVYRWKSVWDVISSVFFHMIPLS